MVQGSRLIDPLQFLGLHESIEKLPLTNRLLEPWNRGTVNLSSYLQFYCEPADIYI